MKEPLWITYAWADNQEGSFDYLASALEEAGVPVQFDRIALKTGQRLWDQIDERITRSQLSGWAYLITPQSLASEPCREELAYALSRTLSKKGNGFPLIGLLSGVSLDSVPSAISTRLCVDLRSPDWIEEIRSGLDNRPPKRTFPARPKFKGKIHNQYLGNTNLRAVEFSTHLGEIRNWRIAFPTSGPHPLKYGIGSSGGGGISQVLRDVVEGNVEIAGQPMSFIGAGDVLTPSTSAYVVFEKCFPVDLAFGWVNGPNDVDIQWWPIMLS